MRFRISGARSGNTYKYMCIDLQPSLATALAIPSDTPSDAKGPWKKAEVINILFF